MKKLDLQPTLVGLNITLRPLTSDDFESLYKVASDPLIWEQHPYSDRYKKSVFEHFFKIALESKGAFLVVDNKTSNVIGGTRFYDLDSQKSEVAIGYTFLDRSVWGGSYNKEMKKLMLDHAFQYMNRVIFHVGTQNIRSQKAMAKIGGVVTGEQKLPGAVGSTEPHLIFSINKEAYKL